MRQAILTKYFSPTNFKGARVKAKAAAGEITLDWDHALNVEKNHERAAKRLVEKLDWKVDTYGGQLFDGNYVFVLEMER